jgi:hypothetical protein
VFVVILKMSKLKFSSMFTLVNNDIFKQGVQMMLDGIQGLSIIFLKYGLALHKASK